MIVMEVEGLKSFASFKKKVIGVFFLPPELKKSVISAFLLNFMNNFFVQDAEILEFQTWVRSKYN